LKLSYVKGIETIRAIGLVLVVVYHLFTNILPGGFFGVDIFFVISGFLVTSLLVREQNEKGKIDIIHFFVRRVRRLLPAAAFMVVATLSLALALPTDLRVGMREQTAAVFGWVTNYFEILTGSSYENQFIPHLFVHTWTLGVEMQYYLIWGVIMAGVFKIYTLYSYRIEEMNRLIYGMQRSVVSVRLVLTLICAGITVFAFVKMQVALPGLDDPSPVYYATSTRIYPLMIGSLLGVLVGMRIPGKRLPSFISLVLLVASVAVIVLMSFKFAFSDTSTYRYGILAVSILSFVIIYCLLSLQHKKFIKDLPVLAYLGKRSYSIYLFHWPVYNIFRQMSITGTWPFPKDAPHLVYAIFAVVVTLALAEVSYRIFEVRKAVPEAGAKGDRKADEGKDIAAEAAQTKVAKEIAAKAAMEIAAKAEAENDAATENQAIDEAGKARKRARRLSRGTAIAFCACTVLSVYTLATVPEQTSVETSYLHQKVLVNIYEMAKYDTYLSGLQMNPVALNGRTELLPPTPSEMKAALDINNDTALTQQNAIDALNREDPAGPILPIAAPGDVNVTVIGDSVTLGAAEIIQKTLGSVTVDAEVSRNMGAGVGIINDYVAKGELGEYVVLALFTNAQYNTEPATHDTIAAIPPGHRVIVVTPFGKDYMEPVADWVRLLPQQYNFVTVADWNAAIRDHTELLAGDHIHMKGDDSRQLYANLLAQAIEQAAKKPAKG